MIQTKPRVCSIRTFLRFLSVSGSVLLLDTGDTENRGGRLEFRPESFPDAQTALNKKKRLSFIAEPLFSDEGARPNPTGVGSVPAQGLDDGPHDHHRVQSVQVSNVLGSVRLRSPVER